MRLSVILAIGFLLISGTHSDAQTDPLSGDARLSAKVSLRRPLTTLREALTDLSTQSRITLSAEKDISGFTVCVQGDGVTLKEVMEVIADFSGYAWRRSVADEQFAYTLFRGLNARNQEADLERQHWQKLLVPLERQVELITRYGSRFKAMTQRDTQAEVERLREEMEALPVSSERFNAEEQFFAAHTAADPGEWALVEAYKALPAEARAHLVRGDRILMATHLPTAVPMPTHVREGLLRARAWITRPGADAPAVDPTVPEVVDFRIQMANAPDGARALLIARTPRRGLQTRAPRLGLPRRALTPSRAEHAEPDFRPSGKLTADNPADLNRRIKVRWTERKRVPDDPIGYFGGVTLAEILRYLAESEPSLRIAGDSPLTALRPDLTKSRTDSPRPALQEVARSRDLTLGRLFTEVVARIPMHVHVRRDGWIVLRSATPYGRKDTSVDPKWLTTAFGETLTSERFTPQAAVAAVAGLTSGQARALGNLQLALLPDLIAPGELDRNYSCWRLIGALKGERRSALLEGTPVRFGSLPPSDKRSAQEFLMQISAEPDGAPYDLELSVEAFNALEVVLGQEFKGTAPEQLMAQRQRGAPRSLQLRLSRPAMRLQQRLLTCRWQE